YALDVTPGELDLLRFERLLADGQATLAADDPATATERFGEALGLWRGEPLADLPPEMLADERARLAELRLRAHELNVDARLAIEAAAELGSQLGDGAFFVDLAPLADPRQVVAAIAAALDIAEQETPTMEAVLATLGDRAAVVVLDNFERLLASADAVSKLL